VNQHKTQNTLLTSTQVAEQLGVTIGTLAGWRSTGTCQIPYLKIGRCVRYNSADIDAFLSDQTHLHTHLKKSGGAS
jgi:predicted site-specific integrase-resolvase